MHPAHTQRVCGSGAGALIVEHIFGDDVLMLVLKLLLMLMVMCTCYLVVFLLMLRV